MKIKLIKTEEDYNQALKVVEALADQPDFGSDQEMIDEFELLSALIEMYDKVHYPVPAGNPIEIIKMKMEYMGLTRKDLSHIVSSGVLSEVFNRKRALSKQMIREFSALLEIDQNALNVPYSLMSEQKPQVTTIRKLKVARQRKIKKVVSRTNASFKFIGGKTAMLNRFKKHVQSECMIFSLKC